MKTLLAIFSALAIPVRPAETSEQISCFLCERPAVSGCTICLRWFCQDHRIAHAHQDNRSLPFVKPPDLYSDLEASLKEQWLLNVAAVKLAKSENPATGGKQPSTS